MKGWIDWVLGLISEIGSVTLYKYGNNVTDSNGLSNRSVCKVQHFADFNFQMLTRKTVW